MCRQGELLVDRRGHQGNHLQRRGEPLLGGAPAQERVDGTQVAVGAAEDGNELTRYQVQTGVLRQGPAQSPRRGYVVQRQPGLDAKGKDAGPQSASSPGAQWSARETGQTTELAMSLAGLAWLQSRQGRESECRRNAGRGRPDLHPATDPPGQDLGVVRPR